jgi:hypothetical protein
LLTKVALPVDGVALVAAGGEDAGGVVDCARADVNANALTAVAAMKVLNIFASIGEKGSVSDAGEAGSCIRKRVYGVRVPTELTVR